MTFLLPDSRKAIAWTATMGLVPGYDHDNDPTLVAERKALLTRAWDEAIAETQESTGFTVSAVMTDSIVLYPRANGCPEGGEHAVTLSGSSNPAYVPEDRFAEFVQAVESTVLRIQRTMEQTSVRIEFSMISRSVYSRLDAPQPERSEGEYRKIRLPGYDYENHVIDLSQVDHDKDDCRTAFSAIHGILTCCAAVPSGPYPMPTTTDPFAQDDPGYDYRNDPEFALTGMDSANPYEGDLILEDDGFQFARLTITDLNYRQIESWVQSAVAARLGEGEWLVASCAGPTDYHAMFTRI